MLIISLFASVVQVVLAFWLVRAPAHAAVRWVGFVISSFVLSGCLASVAGLLNTLLLGAVLVSAIHGRASWLRFSIYAACCTVVSHAVVVAWSFPEPLERMRAQKHYPFESLSGRLAYEKRAGVVGGTGAADAQHRDPADDADFAVPTDVEWGGVHAAVTTKTQSASGDIDEFEARLEEEGPRLPWRGNRERALAQIHATRVEDFINSPGLGVVRMAPRSPVRDAEIAPATTIRLPEPWPVDLDATNVAEIAAAGSGLPLPPAESPTGPQLAYLHRESTVDFVNVKGWGYVQDLDRVAGFQIHHFRNVPSFAERQTARGQSSAPEGLLHTTLDDDWTVRKVELVSLLKHDEPCVYVTDELPRMDRLTSVPTRPLTEWERRALAKLEAGADTVHDESVNQIDLFGGIRAANQCLKCHSVERGDLLGAFSYRLERTRPVRVKREAGEPIF